MPRSFTICGQEVGQDVVDWGETEEVKDVLLAKSQMFVSSHTLELANEDNKYTELDPKSLFYGRNISMTPVQLTVDGQLLYAGLARSPTVNHDRRTVSLVSENFFTRAAGSYASLTTTGNPAAIIQTLLVQAGLQKYIDYASFTAAQGGSAAAGATISVAFVTTGAVNSASGVTGTTDMAAIQAISDLCSLSCFVQGGLIRLQAWQPYQGNLSQVKWQITPANVYDYSTLEYAYDALVNSVNMGYGTSGNYYYVNPLSVKENGGLETNNQFATVAGNTVSVPNLASAVYFGQLYVRRVSTIRRQGSLVCSAELTAAKIGDRCTALAPNWGQKPIAFEIIETHSRVKSDSVELVVASI